MAQRSDIVASAIAYLSDAAGERQDEAAGFTLISSTEVDPQDDLSHVRLQQTIDGIVVWGADSVVHLDAEAILGATGSVAAGIDSIIEEPHHERDHRARSRQAGTLRLARDRHGGGSVEQVIHIADDGARPRVPTRFCSRLRGRRSPAACGITSTTRTDALLAPRWNRNPADARASPGGNKWTHSWNNRLDATINASRPRPFSTTSAPHHADMNPAAPPPVTGAQNIGDAPSTTPGFAGSTSSKGLDGPVARSTTAAS